MPRKPRILIEGGIYHLYNRFTEGLPVFNDPTFVDVFLDLFREIKERDEWTVFAWCLMPNHYHLVVRSGVIPLSRGMRSIDGRFSQRYNRAHQRKGPLWQHRYQSRLVSGGIYLRQVMVYVHLNPVRARIAVSPAEYRTSGHGELMVTTPGSLTDMDEALFVFGETVLTGRHFYSQSLAAADFQQDFTDEVELKLWQTSVDRELNPTETAHVDHLGRSTGYDRPTVRPDLFVMACCELKSVEFERIVGQQRDPETARFRKLIATLGIERWRQRASDLAGVMNKNPDVVSGWASSGSHQRKNLDGWKGEIDELDNLMMIFWDEAGGLTS